jgi:hypothetical protein
MARLVPDAPGAISNARQARDLLAIFAQIASKN